ncbi:acyl-CoA dehydrogenase [Blastomonas fulva]|uniref:acyl-CoA dehydrogenase n=1 Tax=Blastomonas fulva TaxID=1550728 RepID=UPI003F71BC96
MTGPESLTDIAAARQFALLAAVLDHATLPWPEGTMPLLGHWLLFPPAARQSDLGPDGHPRRSDDGFPRRMWAGSRVRFHAPVALGSVLRQQVVTLRSIDKTGRTGAMRFVTLHRQFWCGDALVIEEEQDIVYRTAVVAGAIARPPAPDDAADTPAISRTMVADPALLMRFSALTFNAHRIHYDLDYARDAEGYPGLVVHGPLIATLLLDHFLRHRPGAVLSGFDFQALRPVFAGEPFTLGLDPEGALCAIDAAGGLAMRANVTVA